MNIERLTIIPDDCQVIINSQGIKLQDLTIDTDIHAIQWYQDHGVIEYKDGKQPEKITSLDDFTFIIDKAILLLKKSELNQYGEPKYKEIDGELVEQTEPSLEWIKADLEEKTYSFYDSEPIRLATIQTTDGKSFNYEIKTQALLKLSLVLLTNKDYLYFDKSSGVSIKLAPSKIQHIYDTLMEIGVQNKNIFEQHLANIRSLDEKQDYDYSSGYLKDNVINLANL